MSLSDAIRVSECAERTSETFVSFGSCHSMAYQTLEAISKWRCERRATHACDGVGRALLTTGKQVSATG